MNLIEKHRIQTALTNAAMQIEHLDKCLRVLGGSAPLTNPVILEQIQKAYKTVDTLPISEEIDTLFVDEETLIK